MDKWIEFEPCLSGTNLRIGIVMARFNHDIGEGLLSGARAELVRLGISASDVTL